MLHVNISYPYGKKRIRHDQIQMHRASTLYSNQRAPWPPVPASRLSRRGDKREWKGGLLRRREPSSGRAMGSRGTGQKSEREEGSSLPQERRGNGRMRWRSSFSVFLSFRRSGFDGCFMLVFSAEFGKERVARQVIKQALELA